MTRILPTFAVLFAAHAFTAFANAEAGAQLRVTLPPTLHVVPGIGMSVHFSNAMLTPAPEEISCTATCDVGRVEADRWTFTATPQQVGEHPFTLQARDKSGRVLGEATMKVRVVPADAGRGRDIALLLVGDSLTNASLYPNEIARLLAQPGNPTWRMLGTHRPASVAPDVAHEGYGGWTWKAFNTRFDPKQPMPGRTASSPFVFAIGEKQTPTLDVVRFIAERCDGRTPDFVTFLLGINDCFRLKADNAQALEAGIAEMLAEADKLLAEFHRAAPHATLGVCLTTPPNARDAAFAANYKDAHPRGNWRQVQHRLVERQLAHFGGREREGIHLVPTGLNLDTLTGYPDNNAVHPNAAGYQQIGASIYSWLKARLAEPNESTAHRPKAQP